MQETMQKIFICKISQEFYITNLKEEKLGVVAYTCNPNTGETDAGGFSPVQPAWVTQ